MEKTNLTSRRGKTEMWEALQRGDRRRHRTEWCCSGGSRHSAGLCENHRDTQTQRHSVLLKSTISLGTRGGFLPLHRQESHGLEARVTFSLGTESWAASGVASPGGAMPWCGR